METLKRQVLKAHRRLTLQRFLAVLAWCWFGTLLLAAVAITVDKFYPLGVEPWVWGAGAIVAGLAFAGAWMWATRSDLLQAAVELDRRFGLKERVSSTLALAPDQRDTEIGQALIDDAIRRVDHIDVGEQFRLSLGRYTVLPLLPAAIAVMVAMFLNPVNLSTASARTLNEMERKAVKKEAEVLRQKMIEQRKQARESGLEDAENLLAKIEEGTRQLAKSDEVDQRQALLKLNDLSKELEDRSKQLGNSEQFKAQLDQLKDLGEKGPADKLAQALKNGDFKKAVQELDRLSKAMQDGKLDPEAKEQLAKQMEAMKEKLQQMVQQQEKMQQDLKQQIAQQRAAGNKEAAEKLEEQLAQMQQQNSQMQSLNQLSDKLGQCAECMKKGDGEGAQKAMQDLQQQISSMESQLTEMAMMEDAMEQINECKNGMCQGMGQMQLPLQQQQMIGNGLGSGRGSGDRPEEAEQTKGYNDTVKQKLGPGAAVVTGFVDGPNLKGQVEQQIRTEFETGPGEAADPLNGQQLPRQYQDHTKDYFNYLREGEK